MSQFANKKAVITGASKGLGLAIAKKLAHLGCSVNLIARNEDQLKQNIQDLPIVNSNQIHSYIKYDLERLSSAEDVQDKSRIIEAFNGLSILVNCAGITNHTLLSRIKDESIISTINLNLIVPILMSKIACKPMLKVSSKSSKESITPIILSISSVLSLTDRIVPGTSVYAALKAGILGFSQSLAAELKGRIRVNSILPGLIKETEMGLNSNVFGDHLHTIALKDVVNEVINIIENNSINGQNIIVDGKGVRLLEQKI